MLKLENDFVAIAMKIGLVRMTHGCSVQGESWIRVRTRRVQCVSPDLACSSDDMTEKPDSALGDGSHASSGGGRCPRHLDAIFRWIPARSTCAESRGNLIKLKWQYVLLKKSCTFPERQCHETAVPNLLVIMGG